MRRLPFFLVIISSLFAILLALDVMPWLRGGELLHWQWGYVPAPLGRSLLLLGMVAGYTLGGMQLIRLPRAMPLLLWAMAGVLVMSIGITALHHDNILLEWFERTFSPTATGVHASAAVIDWDANWLDQMRELRALSQHTAISPPGLPLLYHALSDVLATVPGAAQTLQTPFLQAQCHNTLFLSFTPAQRASAWLGTLMPLWALLTVLPLYGLGRRMWGETPARWLALWWALVPAVGMYATSWNTLYPLGALLAFLALDKSLKRDSRVHFSVWASLAGAAVGGLVFANLSLIPLGLLCGCYALLTCWQATPGRVGLSRAVFVGVWFGAGAALVWGIYGLVTGVTLLGIVQVAFEQHLALNRPYVPWLWMHTWEWALMGGLVGVLAGLAAWRRSSLGTALLVTLIALLLSNTARGETGRVWLFLVPFALLAAGVWLRHSVWARALTLGQAAICLGLAVAWQVMGVPDLSPPPPPPAAFTDIIPSGAHFGTVFTLEGWSGRYDAAAQALVLHFNWRADQPMQTPYYLAALPVAPDGTTPYAAYVWQPDATRYPTTCWQVGQAWGETVMIALDAAPQPGLWYLSLSVIPQILAPMDVLPVTLTDGSTDRQIGIGGVVVPE